LRNRKALDFIVQHANVREEEWREEAEETRPAANTGAQFESVEGGAAAAAATGAAEGPGGEATDEEEAR
jgi:hypothetical protein